MNDPTNSRPIIIRPKWPNPISISPTLYTIHLAIVKRRGNLGEVPRFQLFASACADPLAAFPRTHGSRGPADTPMAF